MKKVFELRFLLSTVIMLSSIAVSYSYGYHAYQRKTIISGTIINFENANDLPLIELVNLLPFLTEYETHVQFIDDDGSFRFEIEQFFPEDLYIKFEKYFTFYASPGDSINLIIDATFLTDTRKTNDIFQKYIQVSSPNQRFQNDYQKFINAFNSKFGTIDEFNQLSEAQKELDSGLYSQHVKDRSVRHNLFFDKFVEQERPDSALIVWASNWLYLQELVDLLRYSWLHPMLNELERETFHLPQEYFSFLAEVRHNDENLMKSRLYKRFMHEYYMHLNRKFLQSELSTKFRAYLKNDQDSKASKLQLDYISANSTGFEKEFLLSKFLSQQIFWKFMDIYEYLSDPSPIEKIEFNQILQSEFEELQEIDNEPLFVRDLNLHDAKASEYEPIFTSLPDKFESKVIYVDFWAPWCGPCLAEMPNSKDLQEKMRGSDVVFVFLASRCSEKSWKSTISQKELSGEHFLLNDDEYAMIADKYNIAGIPRYMIIDKEGEIVNDSAPRPSDEELIRVLNELAKQ